MLLLKQIHLCCVLSKQMTEFSLVRLERERGGGERRPLVGSACLKCPFDPPLILCPVDNINGAGLLTPLMVGTIGTKVTKLAMG